MLEFKYFDLKVVKYCRVKISSSEKYCRDKGDAELKVSPRLSLKSAFVSLFKLLRSIIKMNQLHEQNNYVINNRRRYWDDHEHCKHLRSQPVITEFRPRL